MSDSTTPIIASPDDLVTAVRAAVLAERERLGLPSNAALARYYHVHPNKISYLINGHFRGLDSKFFTIILNGALQMQAQPLAEAEAVAETP